MSISSRKGKVLGDVAGMKADATGYLKKTKTNSMASINNKANSIDFLTDLMKSLEDFNEMKQVVIDTIVHKSKDIEVEIKKHLKKELNTISLCSLNPTIPGWAKSSNINSTGINIRVKDLDLLDIFKVDPTSDVGKLLFSDVSSGSQSTDFNTYLSSVIQTNGLVSAWGSSSPLGVNLINIKFNQNGLVNNTINVKISSDYDSLKLAKFNDDFIDSIEILSTEKLINALLDSFSGVISFKTGKSKEQLKREEEVNTIIDNIVNMNSDDVLDDSYFEFTSQDILNMDDLINSKVKGVIKVDVTNQKLEVPLSIDAIKEMNDSLGDTTFDNLKAKILSDSLDAIGTLSGIPSIDIPVIKLNFIESIIKNLIKVLINVIISPKLLIIFIVNLKIVFGDDFTDIKTFIKNNKMLFKFLIEQIKSIIIKIILDRVTKKISELIAKKMVEVAAEKHANTKLQILSLIGPQIDLNKFFK